MLGILPADQIRGMEFLLDQSKSHAVPSSKFKLELGLWGVTCHRTCHHIPNYKTTPQGEKRKHNTTTTNRREEIKQTG